MDGYAFSFHEWQKNKELRIVGELAAGSSENASLVPGSAVRIFTGAIVPPAADTVAMQEKTTIADGVLQIDDERLARGLNVRKQGTDIMAGSIALQKDAVLTAAAIGFLAGVGVAEISVHPNPRVTIIITGNELQVAGQPLSYGQVYDSNSFTLVSALRQLKIYKTDVMYVKDSEQQTTKAIDTALHKADLILLTGGVSVGDYDFVPQSAAACGVKKLFHKVKQRPGKPLYFGNKETTLVFGLPGNPSSVLTCFYQYVLPGVEKMTKRKVVLKTVRAPLSQVFQKEAGLTYFLKGNFDGRAVTPLDAQESFRLSSFARANCLIQINEEVTTCNEGELVDVHLLPAI